MSVYEPRMFVLGIYRDHPHAVIAVVEWAAAFGILATVLPLVGLYGVTSYSVARRRQEIGIRMALGAQQQSIFGMVMREVLVLCATGLVADIPFAFCLGQLALHQIFGIKRTIHGPLRLPSAPLLLSRLRQAFCRR